MAPWAAGLALGLVALSPASEPSGSDPDAASGRGRSSMVQRDGPGQVGDLAPELASRVVGGEPLDLDIIGVGNEEYQWQEGT